MVWTVIHFIRLFLHDLLIKFVKAILGFKCAKRELTRMEFEKISIVTK